MYLRCTAGRPRRRGNPLAPLGGNPPTRSIAEAAPTLEGPLREFPDPMHAAGFVVIWDVSSYPVALLVQGLILVVLVPTRQLGKLGRGAFAHLAPSVAALAFLAHAPAFAESTVARDRATASSPGQDIVWTDNQDSAVCPKRPVWTIAVQGTALLLKTRNFDYQAVPIALRGDGSASMDRVFQPGRNLKYRVSGTFDGQGRMRLRLEDLSREGGPCSWRFEAEYQDGLVPGVKATRSRNP